MLSALEALDRLWEGNNRFRSNLRGPGPSTDPARRSALVTGQEPFAIILGCSDSRVPVEIIFDQGLGDLFVVRVAGNIAAPSQVGSIEFAAEKFGTRLIVVLGHSMCGAVVGTLKEIEHVTTLAPGLRSIIDRIRPTVEPLREAEPQQGWDELVRRAVRANIRASCQDLRQGSQTLERLIQTDGLLVVGGEYSLETGIVDFFEGLPETG